MDVVFQEIIDAQRQFDITTPLTDDELKSVGMLVDHGEGKQSTPEINVPILQDLDEINDSPVGEKTPAVGTENYNSRYAHYLQCQAILALVAFDEGWKSFEQLALLAYVNDRRRENSEYRGDDPNKSFSLRLKQQAAEDFVKFIRMVVHEAANTPKPSLNQK